MGRQGLDAARVAAAAGDLADREGLDAVTLARVAASLGVRSPSLYHHVDGLAGLRRAVALDAVGALAAALREAAVGRSGRDALAATARAYRAYVLAHPGRYAATVRAPAPGDAQLAAAGRAVLDVVAGALRAWRLQGDDLVHALRVVRSAVHGFATLEAAGGFGLPQDVDASFERLVDALASGLGAPGGER
ncbi:MAG TPA: TetR-like C-terminal domain-containing protein, partial [Solirubrobacteraceae bacterium]|nr:TetR-like C-terminal domain-containing protein [Solirubrobacteraceae bacterium]